MAATRDRRNNAGNRYARLLNEEEEEDDFYKTQYGGFSEEKADEDYLGNEDDKDIVDSDFSIDENDEPVSDHDADEPKRKRKKVVTKSYKEPTKQTAKKAAPATTSPKKKKIEKTLKSPIKRECKKSLRKSTAAKSAATQHRIKIRYEAEKMKPKIVKVDERMPTQEELLEEAAQTEKENIKSLEKFRRMELEKKKIRPTKASAYIGPIIRFHSVSMPVVKDEQKTWEGSAEELDEIKRTTRRSRMAASDAAKSAEKNRCERTFISFINDINNKAFDSAFPSPQKRPKINQTCPITKLPAKYFDPVTQLPYHNILAFKILREAYYQMLETKGDPINDKTLSEWLEWRKKSKLQNKTVKTE
ncbi:hypothetical protein PVAND_000397 [Polypedilum vanderplanki]|uniref:Vacuolar protein sorting-associated protein 72 homolog n=1 Tax=Polypedilum vanderplanki TaxID=319348 RepID=A0A9J6BK49_POLVA|nr:hypothetical protein PVAND_000397 [Polypedilum vanderplanki]